MPLDPSDYASALDRAASHARSWLGTLPDRPVPFQADAEAIRARLGVAPRRSDRPGATSSTCSPTAGEPGLTAMPSGRFFGWVIGGTLPGRARRRLAGQRVGPEHRHAVRDARRTSPSRRSPARGCSTCSGLPAGADVGFVTGATMANFTGLAAGRGSRCSPTPAGTSTATGLPAGRASACSSGPSGTTRSTWRCATSASARRRRCRPTTRAGSASTRCADALAGGDRPDDRVPAGRQRALRARSTRSAEAIDAGARARRLGARRRRVRAVGGGLAAAAAPRRRRRGAPTRGPRTRTRRSTCPTTAASRSSRDPAACARAMGMQADYLVAVDGPGRPARTRCPSCRGGPAACPVWAVLRSLGRSGVADLVDGLVAHAAAIADGHRRRSTAPRSSTTWSFTQVCVVVRLRRAHPRRSTARAAGRRRRLDVRLALARPRGAAGLGEQLVDRRRATSSVRSTPCAGPWQPSVNK